VQLVRPERRRPELAPCGLRGKQRRRRGEELRRPELGEKMPLEWGRGRRRSGATYRSSGGPGFDWKRTGDGVATLVVGNGGNGEILTRWN
jgi:hypothetical protein